MEKVRRLMFAIQAHIKVEKTISNGLIDHPKVMLAIHMRSEFVCNRVLGLYKRKWKCVVNYKAEKKFKDIFFIKITDDIL